MMPSKTEDLFSKATILSHGIIREETLPFTLARVSLTNTKLEISNKLLPQ